MKIEQWNLESGIAAFETKSFAHAIKIIITYCG